MKKEIFTIGVGMIGSTIASLFGGWDASLVTLLIFMLIDYISGLIVAAVFNKSLKTSSGGLNSQICFKGLIKKGMILCIVIIACRLDITMNTNYIRDGVCIAFIVNETVSIIENAGLMGIRIPAIITKAIDVLQNKSDGGK